LIVLAVGAFFFSAETEECHELIEQWGSGKERS